MTLFRRTASVTFGLVLISGAASAGLIVAYDMTGIPTGNQAYTGSLGNDFVVNSPILVDALGVYDSGGDGFTGTMQAVIYDTDSQTQVSSVLTFTGTNQTLLDGSRYENFTTPLLLNPGDYTIVAEGFTSADLNANTYCNGDFGGSGDDCKGNDVTDSVTNTGGGLISFVSTFRNGPDNATLEFPTTAEAVGQGYIAGSFEFQAASATPEPMSALLMAGGLLVLTLRRRRFGLDRNI
jgi:hypothetical protein